MLRRHFIINTESSIPNNEIWYTTTDGNTVTLQNTSGLPPIDSNTYNNGKGVIKFQTDITTIVHYAFFTRATLTSIVIPNSVISIKNRAFGHCSALNTIKYKGTIFQWDNITKETGWNENVPATVVHCTDGEVEL